MRVIAGSARGRRLNAPAGLEARPTTDRVKESIFNIIQFDIEGRRVLDLFSGSGQLGIEALSRGAASCVFVEQSEKTAGLIRHNLEQTGLRAQGRVVRQDAFSYLASCGEEFDLIFLDPPYHTRLRAQALTVIATIDNVSDNGIIVCESAADETLPELSAPYRKGKEYRYGSVKITLYSRCEEGSDENGNLSGQL